MNVPGEKGDAIPELEEEVPHRLVAMAAVRTVFFFLAILPLIVDPERNIAIPIALTGLLFFCGVALPRVPGLAVRTGLFFYILGAVLEAWIYMNPGLLSRFWQGYGLISFPSISIFGIWLLFRSSQRLDVSSRAIAMLLVSATMGCFLAIASSSAGGPGWMVQWFIQLGLSPDAAYTTTIAVRKTIHFTYFGLIALFAMDGAMSLSGSLKTSIAYALLWTATFAAFDEISQLASPKRTGSLLDFGLDMLGATVFVLLALRRMGRKSPKRGASSVTE